MEVSGKGKPIGSINRAYMIGQGARSIICSQTEPPSCWPIVWISSKMILSIYNDISTSNY